jgi:transcriptional regulator with XRE-family HTH domain
MGDKPTDPAILKAREIFAESGRTLDDVGLAMGFNPEVARKSVWQLLNKIDDPKLSTLRKFAAAMGVPMSDFFPVEKRNRSK